MFKKRLNIIILALSTSYLMLMPAAVRAEQTEVSNRRQEINAKVESIKSKSKARIEALKQKAETKTAEVRTKACDARKTNIENRLNNRVEAANRHKATFDSIFNRVKDYAESKSLTSTEITALQTSVSTASQKAIDEISALELVDINIDCTNPDNVAITIDTYKNQLTSVKPALKDYRDSIRKYAQAVNKLANVNEGAEQ